MSVIPMKDTSDAETALPEPANTDDPQGPVGAPDVDQLSAMLGEHDVWLSSEGAEGRRLNLRGMDLTGFDLGGLNMAEGNLRHANLAGVNLAETNLRGADLAEAILDGATLVQANLAGANLMRASLVRVNGENADLTSCNATGVKAEGAIFRKARFPGAVLRDANAANANFTEADLTSCQVRGGNWTGSNLTGADLTGADCREINLTNARVHGAIFAHAQMKGAKLEGVELNTANMQDAIDLSLDAHSQALQTEKYKLQKELAEVKATRDQLTVREKQLLEDRRALEDDRRIFSAFSADISDYVKTIRRSASWFGYTSALWFFVAAGFVLMVWAAAADMKADEIDWSAAGFFFGILFGVFLLFFVSMIRALAVGSAAKKIGKIYREKMVSLTSLPQEEKTRSFRGIKSVKGGAFLPNESAE